jgi:hypothetical protein
MVVRTLPASEVVVAARSMSRAEIYPAMQAARAAILN